MKASLGWHTPAPTPESAPSHSNLPEEQDRGTKAAFYFMLGMMLLGLLYFILLPLFI